MPSIDVSVIIPTFNRRTILEETLSCLCKQTFARERYEVIVIDDCSSDDTEEYLHRIKLPIRINCVRNKQNLGRAKTRNFGLKIAQGKYVLMIDDDIWAEKSLIERHFDEHQKRNKQVAIVGAILASPRVPQTAINEHYNNHHLWCYKEMIGYEQNLPYNLCKSANLSLARGLLEKVGFFDESFTFYGGEDTEFGYRLFKNNIILIFAREAIGHHYHDEPVESLIAREIERGKSYLVYRKIHPEHEPDTRAFFSPSYHKEFALKPIFYNLIKTILFTASSRFINRILIKSINKTLFLRFLLVRYLIPILQMQYYRYGLNEAKNENWD